MTLPLAVIKPCDGEAHSNPWIDHCMVCIPHWGFTLHCASCDKQLQYTRGAKLIRRCPVCGITHARIDYQQKWIDSERAEPEADHATH